MLRQGTTTDLNADQVHALGLAEVARLQGEIRAVAAELGYSTEDWVALWGQVYQDCEVVDLTAPGGQQVALDEFAALIDAALQASQAVFDLRAIPGVEVQPEPAGQGIGAYYSPAPDDGSRPPTFFISLSGSSACVPMMQRVAYHEAVPGHHLQIASAQQLDLPTFRRDMILNGYAEGWAVYAERLADELGLYADPVSQLGYLRGQLYLAARVVMDTGLHSQGWTPQEAAAYVEEAMGMSPGAFLGAMDRYVAWPGQATGYTIGQLYMLELRQRAMERLGDQFDLIEFHSVILDGGSVPLEILEQIVDDYIQQKLDS
jgi:uncharacterized protein (DUF885 family)